jgi:uncharacterized protein YbbC (DUF1343 family)
MVITNRYKLDPMRTLVTIAREIYGHLPEKTREKNWQRIANGVGDTGFIQAIAKGEPVEKLIQMTEGDVRSFSEERKKFLLYP